MTVRGNSLGKERLFFIGLFDIVVTLFALFAFFYSPPSPAPAQLNFFGIPAGAVTIGGLSFEHEYAFVGILIVGFATFTPILMILGLAGYLTDFGNLFGPVPGLSDFVSNPYGSVASIILGVWLGANLFFVVAPLLPHVNQNGRTLGTWKREAQSLK